MTKLYNVFVIIIVANTFTPSTVHGDVLDIISVGKDIVIAIAKAWNIVDDHFDFTETPTHFVQKTEKKLFNKMTIIQHKLGELHTEIDAVGQKTISNFMRYLPERLKLEHHLNDLRDYITRINVFHRSMNNYINNTNIERATLEDFAIAVLSHNSGSVQSLLERIHSFIVSSEGQFSNTNILQPLANTLKEVEGDMLCNTNQSPQQVLYNLYNTIALTELKGYMMMQFSYMLLKLYQKGNFTEEVQLKRDGYQERTNAAIASIKKAMEGASREMWKCDPKNHVKDETYVEVTQLLQGYIQNEVDLNPEGTCRETCSEYAYTKSHNCFKNLYCRQQRRCNGKIINCKYIDSDMWVCPAEAFDGRRYEYIKYENGHVLGREQSCRKGTVKVDSWWRWLFWHCSYCFCLCDEQGVYSDRYFNMRSAISDLENNKVVTGLRFVKKNRIIHLQIQEGKLLPRGNIDPTTIRWVPAEDYKITDRNIFNGQDYHTMSWEQRSMDLDDLMADEGHLITGVRFKRIGSHLNFEIYITPFDFTTGKLIEPLHRSMWKDNINTDVSLKNPRTQVHLKNPDIPTRVPITSVPDSKSDQYIEFTHTDMDRDAAQTTVPFLDAQKVESLIPVPLSGAGIYHKGRKYSGGFVAPKIITYDYSQHLQAEFPDGEFAINKK